MSYDELGCDDCSSLRGDDCALCSDCDDSFDGDNGHSSQCDDDHDGCVHDDCCAHAGDDDDDQSSDVYDVDDDNDHDLHLMNDVCYDCVTGCVYEADDTLTDCDDLHDNHLVHDDVRHNCDDDHSLLMAPALYQLHEQTHQYYYLQVHCYLREESKQMVPENFLNHLTLQSGCPALE